MIADVNKLIATRSDQSENDHVYEKTIPKKIL